ncbi:methyltransferase domain-containing protein [Maridesulfovibrio hydrothermalis]|uniref:Methyltransferase type 11 n=1 Tax=Maridesulfovibrio hydrothermalis AM13 = DSM 14728 TaxID=1121451 RepID=L0RA12_9BACT|nr:methyltransferase domain-containing protein [Maridesulfovibrio hydrothermalis]CCO23594.1 Methyltransferase type 11 [Maridesulfovibrio hydrothermalis AM13 = DSM 14728]
MNNPIIIIQAASRAWCGTADWCMNKVEGKPVVALTVERALAHFPEADIRITAPEFDKGGLLDTLPALFPDNKVSVFYGFDSSPLERMIGALEKESDQTLIIRVDGLHFGWVPDDAEKMLAEAQKSNLDCIKLPDDYPVQLSSDVYRLSALKKAADLLSQEQDAGPYRVHPKFYMIRRDNLFKTAYHNDYKAVPDSYLEQCRETAKDVYITSNTEVAGSKISHGDQFSFHYQLGLDFIKENYSVLDIACGWGYGARMLARKAAKVTAADLDIAIVRKAAAGKYFKNITFQTGNATDLGFADNTFDAVTSFETVEHVDHAPYFSEMHRVIKPGGLLIFSTPQNILGHIPVNSQHRREYSLEEISTLCSEHFEIVKVIGIKQGRVVFPDDPKGQNTFMVCRKPER